MTTTVVQSTAWEVAGATSSHLQPLTTISPQASTLPATALVIEQNPGPSPTSNGSDASTLTERSSLAASTVSSSAAPSATASTTSPSAAPSATASTSAIATTNSDATLPAATLSWPSGSTLTGPVTTTGSIFGLGDANIVYTLPTYLSATADPQASTTSNATIATPSASRSPDSGNSNVSPGALAGGIVGAALGAALLAFLVAFLLFRRKPRGRGGAAYLEDKPDVYPWDHYLPESADDAAIRQSVESLYSQIDMHVENYYGANATGQSASPDLLTKLDSGKLPNSLAMLLASSSTPVPIVKHSIAWAILTQLAPGKEGEPCLLPAQFARIPPQLVGGTQEKSVSRDNQETAKAYRYWRILTAHLMYPRSNKRSVNVEEIPSARSCIETLSAAFAPWSKDRDAAQRHLSSVIKSAAETGLLLISQPSTFNFTWRTAKHPGSVETFPALEKTADERGSRLQQRQVLIESRSEAVRM